MLCTAVVCRCSQENMLEDISAESPVTATVTPAPLNQPVVSWDLFTEPYIASSTATSHTLKWTPIVDAVKYEIYSMTRKSPHTETYYTETIQSTQIATSYLNEIYHIKALDKDDIEIDSRVVDGYFNNWLALNSALPISGTFFDDFNDGVIDSRYFAYDHGYPEQISESAGVITLSQNYTDQGPQLYILYDAQEKRYVKLSLKWYQHRSNNNYNGQLSLFSYSNNSDYTHIGNFHEEYTGHLGTDIMFLNYTRATYTPFSYTIVDLDSVELFDQWLTWDILLDRETGDCTVTLNGTTYPVAATGLIFRGYIIIRMDCSQWFTGSYVKIDDLHIEATDTP